MFRCFPMFALMLALSSFRSDAAVADQPLLQSGDTLALVGGTFVERMQSTPWLELELHSRQPHWQLRLRNLGWSGDDVHGFARKVFETNPEKGFQRLQADLDIAAPSVVLIAYGFAEASNGEAAVQRYEPGLERLVTTQLERGRRVILMPPFELPGVRTPGYAQWIAACVEATGRVGQRLAVPVIEVRCDGFTDDGLLPSDAGYRMIARQLADVLAGPCDPAPAAVAVAGDGASPGDETLAKMILAKDELFFHRHRPQNETYLFLFRKHEQGNNAVEMPQFDPLIDQAEQKIWQRAQKLSGAGAEARPR